MNIQPSSLNRWNLFVLPQEKTDFIYGAIAHVALGNSVIVLDCGQRYDATAIARKARGRKDVTDRIKTQRAFTCHGAIVLLEEAVKEEKPVFVLNLLSTFHDGNVKLSTRKYLLERAIENFQKISYTNRLFVTTPTPLSESDVFPLYKRLVLSCPQVFAYKTHTPKPQQLRLA